MYFQNQEKTIIKGENVNINHCEKLHQHIHLKFNKFFNSAC